MYRVPALVPDAHPKPTSLSEILLQTNVNTIVNLTSAICAPLAAPGLAWHPMPPCLHYPSLLSLFRCCRCGGYVIGPQLNYHISNEWARTLTGPGDNRPCTLLFLFPFRFPFSFTFFIPFPIPRLNLTDCGKTDINNIIQYDLHKYLKLLSLWAYINTHLLHKGL